MIRLRRLLHPNAANLLAFLLFALVYWWVARAIQSAGLAAVMPAAWVQLLRAFPLLDLLTPVVVLVWALISPLVLRHFIPLAVGAWLGRSVVLNLMRALYELPSRADAASLLGRLRSGVGPTVALDRLRFAEQRKEELLRVGGPGVILVSAGDVVVTERNGRFERVLGSGRQTLKLFETIHDVLDLREQTRFEESITLVTREGLSVRTAVHLVFRLRRRDQRASRIHLFTYDEAAVRRAAYSAVVTDLGVQRWDDIPLQVAIGELSGLVAELRLDQLIDPAGVYRSEPLSHLQRTLEGRVRQIVRDKAGVELLSLRLGALQFDEAVHKTLTAYWEARGEKSEPLDENPQQAPERAQLARKRARQKMIDNLAAALAYLQEKDKTIGLAQGAAGAAAIAPATGSAGSDLAMLRLVDLLQQLLLQQRGEQVQSAQTGSADDADAETTAEALIRRFLRQLETAQAAAGDADNGFPAEEQP